MTKNLISPPDSLAFIYPEVNLKVIPWDNLEKKIGSTGDRTRDFSLRRRIHHQNSVMNVISEHTKPKESAGAVSFFVT